MTSERNRAVRIAYAWARKGEKPMVDLWLSIADGLAPVTDKQRAHAGALLARPTGPIPGQIDIEGRVAA